MYLNLLAPINSLGYGVVGFNILKALHDAGHRVSLFPISPLRDDDVRGYVKHIDTIKAGLKNAQTYEHAPSIRIWHTHELDKFVGTGERIGWPIFELDKFTDQELHQMRRVDRLFVCSKWAKDVVHKYLPDLRIDVIPLGVDLDVFKIDNEARATRPYWTTDTTIFLNVGKWEKRKGHEELLEAFNKAFTEDDDVELWMMNDNPFIGNKGNLDWRFKYLSSPLGSKIKMIDRKETQDDMRVLFNQVDFGVFPSHAEGWNLEILEMMACGKPCIATNYSGHTEFLDESNSLLVETNGLVPAHDGIWFHGQGQWASFEVSALVEQMKRAHRMKLNQCGQADLALNAIKTAKNFTWTNSARKIAEVL